ncbi:hypothetical protein FE257_011638 [Aspergillus nanangensis]|uniref:Uncharacterized protein n=1 Tax=Aspergillus nanangensis TaxID=2582783 RepID=A0AAD4GXY7_ASPNN|nr:hypothetical protein FE257_011638 [Aspergillus nanangensis]
MTSPIQPRYTSLFHELESHIYESRFEKTTSLPADKWYILALATIAAGPDPEHADQLYLHLIQKPQQQTPTARQALVRRLREALLKSSIIIGIPKPIESIVAIDRVEQAEDKDYTFTRRDWCNDGANHDRAMGWFQKLYEQNTAGTLDLFAAHKDFSWLSQDIAYGLFLSDRQVLDDVDTELVVLPAIMCQNLRTETHWHIRGTRRLGVPKEDVQVVWDCVQIVARFSGVTLDKVPTVEDVEYDV